MQTTPCYLRPYAGALRDIKHYFGSLDWSRQKPKDTDLVLTESQNKTNKFMALKSVYKTLAASTC